MLSSLKLVLLIAASIGAQPPPVRPGLPIVPGVNSIGPGFNPYYSGNGQFVPITSYVNNHNLDGSYDFSFTTGDGKQAQEVGYLRDTFVNNQGETEGIQVVEGSYSYVSPDGTPVHVSYIADDNGFRTLGVNIPSNGRVVPITPVPATGIRNIPPVRGVPVQHPLNNAGIPLKPNRYDSRYGPYNPNRKY